MNRVVVLTEGKSIVQVVLPHAWVLRINQLAVERGLNRSAVIREAIAWAYFTNQIGGEAVEVKPSVAQ
jgi:hypothetical protein